MRNSNGKETKTVTRRVSPATARLLDLLSRDEAALVSRDLEMMFVLAMFETPGPLGDAELQAGYTLWTFYRAATDIAMEAME